MLIDPKVCVLARCLTVSSYKVCGSFHHPSYEKGGKRTGKERKKNRRQSGDIFLHVFHMFLN